MIYILVQVAYLFNGLVAFSKQRMVLKKLAIIVTVGVAILAICRGDVGTDTTVYETLVERIMNGNLWVTIEPGFTTYVYLSKIFTDNSVLITRGLSAVFFLLILIYLWRATYDEVAVLMLYFAPNYFLQLSMNGLRIGIATAAFLVALQFFRRSNNLRSLCFASFGTTFHISIIFAIILAVSSRLEVTRLRGAIVPLISILLITYVGIIAQNYILQKTEDYTTITSPGGLSGLSPVGRIFIMIAFASHLRFSHGRKLWFFMITVSVTLVSYYLSFYSYAGLRFLEIIASVLPFLLLLNFVPSNYIDRKFCAGLILAGFLGGANVTIGMFESAHSAGTPFVPYHFLTNAIIDRG